MILFNRAQFGIFILVLVLSVSLQAGESGFQKVPETIGSSLLVNENSHSTVKLEESLQRFKARSDSSLRYSLGFPLERRSVGPSAQMDLIARIKAPLHLACGVGYTQDTRNGSLGQARNYHFLPVNLSLGINQRMIKNFRLNAEAGPTYKFVFERGFTPEQNENHSYLDLQAFLGISYEWSRSVTNSGREIGLRYQRYFGVIETDAVPAMSLLFGFMTWDI
jgi:hypothetical protein